MKFQSCFFAGLAQTDETKINSPVVEHTELVPTTHMEQIDRSAGESAGRIRVSSAADRQKIRRVADIYAGASFRLNRWTDSTISAISASTRLASLRKDRPSAVKLTRGDYRAGRGLGFADRGLLRVSFRISLGSR